MRSIDTIKVHIPDRLSAPKNTPAPTLIEGLSGWRPRQIRIVRMRLEERRRERERIARELHDTFLQSTQALVLMVHDIAERLPAGDPMREVVTQALNRGDQILAEGRNRIYGLRAGAPLDIAHALAAANAELAPVHRVEFRVLVNGQPRAIEPAVADEIVMIGREALHNAFKHAKAGTVEVQLTYSPDELRLQIRDDGIGIAPDALRPDTALRHWGLTGMQERARAIAAQLDVWSSGAGTGTNVDLRVGAAAAYRRATDPWRLRRCRAPSRPQELSTRERADVAGAIRAC